MFAAFAWIGLAIVYLLFAGQVSRNEVIAGMGASVVGALFAVVSQRAVTPFRLRLGWLQVALSVARSAAVDTASVGVGMVRGQPGLLTSREAPRRDAGQRAVLILTLSVAPNSFVVRDDGDALVLHELVQQRP